MQDVHVKVNTLKFAIRDSKHDFLYKTLRPLASGLIKRQIQNAIKDALITGFEYIDGQLVAVRDRMESAQDTEDVSRTEILKDVSDFFFIFKFDLIYSFYYSSSLERKWRRSLFPLASLAFRQSLANTTSRNSRL